MRKRLFSDVNCMTNLDEAMSHKIDWNSLWEIVRKHKRFILTSHVRPDGDSLGSQLAMAETLEKMGKETLLLNQDPVPHTLTFLDPDGKVVPLAELPESKKEFAENADCHIILDLSSWSQLGAVADLYRDADREKIIIDHHNSKKDLPGHYFLDPDAEATGSLVFEAIECSGVPMSKSTAFFLMTAIATDTGWFRFSSVKPSTFRIVAALMERGVVPAELYRLTNEQETLARLRLIGRALDHIETHHQGDVMFTWLLQKDFDEVGAHRADSEDIVNELLKIKGAKEAIIMVEQKSGIFKVSFRSRCAVDCSLLAAKFNGGGHPQAAGASCDLPFRESKQALIRAAEEALDAVES